MYPVAQPFPDDTDRSPSPTIVSGLGYTGSAAQLHTGKCWLTISEFYLFDDVVPPYVPAAVLTGGSSPGPFMSLSDAMPQSSWPY